MKARILILLAISAVVLFSFTFATVKNESKQLQKTSSVQSNDSEPIGGFVSDIK